MHQSVIPLALEILQVLSQPEYQQSVIPSSGSKGGVRAEAAPPPSGVGWGWGGGSGGQSYHFKTCVIIF